MNKAINDLSFESDNIEFNSLADFLNIEKNKIIRHSVKLNKLKEKRRNIHLILGQGSLSIPVKLCLSSLAFWLGFMLSGDTLSMLSKAQSIGAFLFIYSVLSISTISQVEKKVVAKAFRKNISYVQFKQLRGLLPPSLTSWLKRERKDGFVPFRLKDVQELNNVLINKCAYDKIESVSSILKEE